ncbi:hypothetical protein KAR91_45120 [Candidatus Pacearchaeota archaeon]|nr:hypothetical protein [Candidatus Pacearchaeota archaeon]
MSEDQALNIKKIYINLLNEGTDVLRPVDAVEISPNTFRILELNEKRGRVLN